ncbi:MAG: putative quinol monooxygenase [Pseudomonadota bacterium]
MYVVTVLFQIKPGSMAAFMPLMVDNARTSLCNEPGCLQFDVCPDPNANEVFLYEIYNSRAGFDLHLASPHFQSFDAVVAPMIASKSVRCFDEVIR